MSVDVLSEVLRAVRLTGAVFFNVEGAAPWVAEAPPAHQIRDRVLPGAEHVMEYHVVVRGSCWAGLIGEPGRQVQRGDVIVFPHGDAHTISSAPGMRCAVNMDAYTPPRDGQLPVPISFSNSGGEHARIVCGFIGFDSRPFNPLLATLPRVIHVPARAGEEGALIEQLIRVALIESSVSRPGGQHVLARLSELLFVEMVRHHVGSLPGDTTGWLAGLRDDLVGRALCVMHERPQHAWSLDDLAKEVGVSRSVLAERFHHFVGTPPMQYLASWRMQLAASLLAGTNLSIAHVAERIGYGSEAAFSRAFKRLCGFTPSAWREGERTALNV
jgi:AraC-like DNA-binding protein